MLVEAQTAEASELRTYWPNLRQITHAHCLLEQFGSEIAKRCGAGSSPC